MSTEAEITAESPPRTGAPSLRSRLSVVRPWVPELLAGGAVLLSGALLLHWLSRLTFWRDEWGILLHRRGWSVGTFLDPAVEHLIALPILIYKILLSTAGMGSPRPFQIVAVLIFLASVALLFIYVRSRVGGWLALAAILPVLFLGPSWDDLLFPYQMAFFGSVACGIGALLALERRSVAGDVVVTILLVAALLFSDLGIPFFAGATVEVILDRNRAKRAFVVVVPTLLWLAWYAGWGHTARTFISFHNLANLPSYVLDGLASSLATLLGLNQGAPLDWGRPLLVPLLLLAGWRLYRLHRPSDRLLGTLAVLLGFWVLTGIDTSVLGLPTSGRYQYIGIVLMLLVAAELARGIPRRRWVVGAILAVAAVSTLANLTRLRDAAHGLAGNAQQERGSLAALELTRGEVSPNFAQSQPSAAVANFLGFLDAKSYFAAVDAYGSPAYPPAELAGSPERARIAADTTFAAALDIKLVAAAGVATEACRTGRVATGRPGVLPVPPAGLVLRRRAGAVQAALRRYATSQFPVALGSVPRAPTLLRIPADRSPRPWTLQLSGAGRVTVCSARTEP